MKRKNTIIVSAAMVIALAVYGYIVTTKSNQEKQAKEKWAKQLFFCKLIFHHIGMAG
jgi:predicted permease